MKYNLIFLNPICLARGRSYRVDGPSYVAEFARNTFADNDIQDCHFPISQPFQRKTLDKALGDLFIRLFACLQPDRLNLVGVTHWTSNSRLARALITGLRWQCQSAGIPLLVLAGGPFFARETLQKDGAHFPDSVEAALAQTLPDGITPTYDAVIYGGFQALLDLLRAVEADELRRIQGRVVPRTLPAGYYFREDSTVVGSGRSPNAPILRPPIAFLPHRATYDTVVMFSNNCSNGCDYCSTGQKHRFGRFQVHDAVRDFIEKVDGQAGKQFLKQMRYLKLLDPNPLSEASRQHTGECLEEFYSQLGFTPALHCFYDSHAFRQPEAVLADIRNLKLHRMFVGRESTGEPGLSFLGRRYRGRFRTAADVDEERAGLDEVIRRQVEARGELALLLYYILTPADTLESLQRTVEDMRHFCAQSYGKVRVEVQWELLWPNSGTNVIRNYTDLLTDDPYFAVTGEEVWDLDRIRHTYPHSVFERFAAQNSTRSGTGPDSLAKIIQRSA